MFVSCIFLVVIHVKKHFVHFQNCLVVKTKSLIGCLYWKMDWICNAEIWSTKVSNSQWKFFGGFYFYSFSIEDGWANSLVVKHLDAKFQSLLQIQIYLHCPFNLQWKPSSIPFGRWTTVGFAHVTSLVHLQWKPNLWLVYIGSNIVEEYHSR